MEIFTMALFFLAPTPILAWAIYTKKSYNKIIGYTLLAALILGVISQIIFPGHPHVPGSDFIFVVFELVITAGALAIVFGYRFLHKKYRST